MHLKVIEALNKLTKDLNTASRKHQEYTAAIAQARASAEELSELCQKIITQPHICLGDYEIDN